MLQIESKMLLENNNVSLYLNHVNNRFLEEIGRSRQCYHETTSPQIIKIMEEELISSNMNTIIEVTFKCKKL